MKKSDVGIAKSIVVGIIIAIIVIAAVIAAVGLGLFSAPSEKDEIKVGVILYGHRDLGSWDITMANGVLDLISDGYPIVPSYSEEVAIVDAPVVIRNSASINDVVFVTTFIYADATVEVAQEFPDTAFILQLDTVYEAEQIAEMNLPNILMFTHEDTFAQSFYLQGYCAGLMTETDAVGAVVCDGSPSMAAKINAFVEGLHTANPQVEFPYVIIGAFSDPVKSRDATQAMVTQGCDAILNFMDDNAVDEAALSLGVWSIHMYQDAVPVFPDTIQSNAVWKVASALKDPMQAVIDGNWKQYWKDAGIGGLTLQNDGFYIKYGNMVPESVISQVDAAESQIISGQLNILATNSTWP